MRKLNKYKLDFDTTWKYVVEDLNETNVLSLSLLELLNFKEGCFFTLLPESANIQAMHNFNAGWILPPNPIEEYIVNGKKAKYSIKTSIRHELSILILNKIIYKHELSCFMDVVSASPKDKYYTLYSDNYSYFYVEEVYYFLNKENISIELLRKCLKAATSFWHSLCVFTTANFNGMTKTTLSLEKIKEICLTTELVMIGAYDGEGYVFWEKNLTSPEKGFFEEKND